MATIKKAQSGVKVVEKKTTIKVTPKKTFKTNPDSGGVAPFTDKEQTERRKKLGLPTSDKEKKAYYDKMSKEGAKNGKSISKAKNGKSFPDLNKDGKITKADILKGRGVIAKKGASVKKCKYGCK